MTYINYSPTVRATFLASQLKQGMSYKYVGNRENRYDPISYSLKTPQRPIVQTIGQQILKTIENSSLINANVAIMTDSGLTEEDATVLDKASVERYWGVATVEHVYSNTLDNKTDHYGVPNKSNTSHFNKNISYDKLDPKTGYPKIGSILRKGDIWLGKIREIKASESGKSSVPRFIDKSLTYKGLDPGIVVDVVAKSGTVKIKVRILRLINVGDKMASFNAQKMIVSNLRNPEDMPFDENGLRPHIILGTTCMITRLTQNQMKVMVAGLVGLVKMAYQNGNGFSQIDTRRDFINLLVNSGYKYTYGRTLYDGKTGKPIKCKIFMAPTQYMRLKQMVTDKVYSREKGAVDPKMRQPTKGRPQGGGIRVEEMARDSLITHGVTNTIHELLFDKSDPFERYLSNTTGHFCVGNPHHGLFMDGVNGTDFSRVRIPWVLNHIYYLMMCIGINMQFDTKKIKTINKKRISRNVLTKYEKTSIITVRALQLQRGANPFIKASKSDNIIDIARRELYAGKLGKYIIERKMPDNKLEHWYLHELKIFKD
jgi:DNA-directed RNA polymerase beta subunit